MYCATETRWLPPGITELCTCWHGGRTAHQHGNPCCYSHHVTTEHPLQLWRTWEQGVLFHTTSWTKYFLMFKVVTILNINVFWDVTLCSLVDRYCNFIGTFCHHLQVRRVEQCVSLICWYISTLLHGITSHIIISKYYFMSTHMMRPWSCHFSLILIVWHCLPTHHLIIEATLSFRQQVLHSSMVLYIFDSGRGLG